MTSSVNATVANFSGRILFLGFGSIVVASLPLFFKHICSNPSQYHIIAKDSPHWKVADSYGISYDKREITRENYKDILEGFGLTKGDFLVNLTVEVNCPDLMLYCNKVGALYLDTCVEPWIGEYTDPSVSNSHKSNYAQREKALAIRDQLANGPTAVIAHGANPGLVNHFVKRALLEMAHDDGVTVEKPTSKEGWAKLAQTLGVRIIQISERDTQQPEKPKQRGEFVNTWSIDGFVAEGIFQPSELGWGTHEKELPVRGAKHDFGCQSAIYIDQPGASIKVRGWTPDEGPYHGFLVTHNESIGIADHFTLKNDAGEVEYRPTVYYCYHPADCAVASVHEILGGNSVQQLTQRLILDEVTTGVDELGVLLLGNFKGYTGYWHGSNLSIEQTRELAPYNNATSLQVAAGVLSAAMWAIQNPNAGLVEPDDIDHEFILGIADQYLGQVVSARTSWTPTAQHNAIIKEEFDNSDPWQFKNFRVKF